MSDSSKFVKAALFCSCVFSIAVILSALLSKMIITDKVYLPISPDLSAVTVSDTLVLLSRVVRSSAIQTSLLFFSGFSLFAIPTAAVISVFRGVSLGYTAASLSGGALVTSSGNVATVGDYAPIIIIYFISGAIMIILSARAVSYSANISAHAGRRHGIFRYLGFFLTFSGVIFTADVLKLLFL